VIYDVAVPISPDDYAELEGVPFTDVSALTECSKTNLRRDVPRSAEQGL
jgi:hypothetical protein